MRLQLRFPIRLKIMVALMFVITSVVSLITFTMGRLFNQDKTAYIHDLTSLIALHTAEEARSQLDGYRERLLVFGGVMYEQGLTQPQKNDLLKRLFEDFQEFVAVTLYVNGEERATVYDAHQLLEAGIDRGDLASYRLAHPLPMDRIRVGEAYVENSTLSDKLLSLTLAIPYPVSKGTDSVVISAVIRLDDMLRLASRSKAFETLIIDRQGTPQRPDPCRARPSGCGGPPGAVLGQSDHETHRGILAGGARRREGAIRCPPGAGLTRRDRGACRLLQSDDFGAERPRTGPPGRAVRADPVRKAGGPRPVQRGHRARGEESARRHPGLRPARPAQTDPDRRTLRVPRDHREGDETLQEDYGKPAQVCPPGKGPVPDHGREPGRRGHRRHRGSSARTSQGSSGEGARAESSRDPGRRQSARAGPDEPPDQCAAGHGGPVRLGQDRHASGPRGPDRDPGPRHGTRDPRRDPGQDLRTVLHDEAGREGHRARAFGQLR